MVKKIKLNYLFLFCIIPEDMLTFLSGIFVATAINILTCRLPDSVLIIGKVYLLVAVMLLIVAFFLIRWSIYIKPIHETYSGSNVSIEKLGEKQCWYNLVEGNKAKRLIFYFNVIVALSVISFILLIFPNIFERAGCWIIEFFQWNNRK